MRNGEGDGVEMRHKVSGGVRNKWCEDYIRTEIGPNSKAQDAFENYLPMLKVLLFLHHFKGISQDYA